MAREWADGHVTAGLLRQRPGQTPRAMTAAIPSTVAHLTRQRHAHSEQTMPLPHPTNSFPQFPEKLIPKFTLLANRGADLPIHGDGTSVRSYLYVEDVAEAFDCVLHKGVTGGWVAGGYQAVGCAALMGCEAVELGHGAGGVGVYAAAGLSKDGVGALEWEVLAASADPSGSAAS